MQSEQKETISSEQLCCFMVLEWHLIEPGVKCQVQRPGERARPPEKGGEGVNTEEPQNLLHGLLEMWKHAQWPYSVKWHMRSPGGHQKLSGMHKQKFPNYGQSQVGPLQVSWNFPFPKAFAVHMS
jgi:hypothetical protein